jgi:DNA-binding MarR family transcriptional regulator
MSQDQHKLEGKPVPAGASATLTTSLPSALMVWNSFILWRTFQQVVGQLLEALAPTGLRLAHNSILTLLEEGPLSQIALSTRLNTDRTTMVGLIDELEAKGLVERRRNLHDRRLYDVTITPKGGEVLHQLQALITSTDQHFFEPLSDQEQNQLRALLLRLIRPYGYSTESQDYNPNQAQESSSDHSASNTSDQTS